MIFRPPGARKHSDQEVVTQNGFVESFDGTRIFFSKEGEGRPLVFVYGLVCSSLHWTYQIEHFRHGYQTVWFDYRGHHHSEMPKDISSLTVPALTQDLIAVLDHENIRDAIFLGHSMGANVVLELFRQQPERVRAMVLANGTPRSPLEHIFRNNLSLPGYELLKRIHSVSPELMKKLWRLQKNNPVMRLIIQLGGFNPHLTPKADIDLYVDQVLEMDPAIFLQVIGEYQKHDCTSWLHTVNVPTLIVAGENDNITPLEQQKLLHQLIPNSQFVSIKHGSHCPQMDLPELFNMTVQTFLNEQGYYSVTPGETTHSDQGNLQSTQRDPSTPFS